MMRVWRLFCLYTLLYIASAARAVTGDSLEVGLLTCSPGSEVYALYGHTAIRVRSIAPGGEDWVFNYGLFSFNRPHFVWRFALGECDYQVGAEPYRRFEAEYAGRGSSVYQQTLNLTGEEKLRLLAILLHNTKPENRVYRYNFFYDNCTTRARDRIEDAIDGEVVYPVADTVRSFRQIIHQYTAGHPWAQLGNDICLGAEADRPATDRQAMFAPFYFMRYLDGAVVRGADGVQRPLVLSTTEVVKGRGVRAEEEFPVSPAVLAWGVLAFSAALTVWERMRRGRFWWLDFVLMTVVGAIGTVVAFLFFFSLHPAVGSNWQLWVFNPLTLLAMPWVVCCAARRRKTRYHLLNAAVLILFMIFSAFIPQDFCVVVVPLALALLLRSCSYCVNYRKEDKNRGAHAL